MHYIYLITTSDNQRYVGVSKNPKVRLKQHIAGRGSTHLKGRDDLQMCILLSGPERKMYVLEEFFIQTFGTLNIAKGGVGGFSNQTGEDNLQAKLTEAKVLEIRNLAANDMTLSYEQIATKYNVSREVIGNICKHKLWNHIGGPKIENRYDQVTNLINYDRVNELYLKGLTPLEIAATVKCCKSSVYKIIKKLGYNQSEKQAIKKQKLIEECKQLSLDGWLQKDIAAKLNISCPTVRKYLREIK